MKFLTVESAEYEYVINKSRFLGFCRRVETADEAAEFLSQLRKKFRDATHVCYAFTASDSSRSSDDGEPSGTAGVPIMESITTAGLDETLVAVVRYFGGVKLGAGGLTRAYSHTAAETLSLSKKLEVADCAVFCVSLDYSIYKKIEKAQLKTLYKTVGMEYNSTVDITYATLLPDDFISEITDVTQGKFTCKLMGNERVTRAAKG